MRILVAIFLVSTMGFRAEAATCEEVANSALTSLQLPKIGETPKPVGKRFNIRRTGETLARPEISDGIEIGTPARFTAMVTTSPQGVSGWVINIERKQSEDVRIHRMKTRLTFAVSEKAGKSICRFTRAEFAFFKKPTDKEVWVRKTTHCLKAAGVLPSDSSEAESEKDAAWITQDCQTATLKT